MHAEVTSRGRRPAWSPLRAMARSLRTLRGRLGLSTGLLTLALALGLSWALAQYAKRDLVMLAGANVEILAQQMARELAGGMDVAAREIQLQAGRALFRDPGSSRTELRAAVESIRQFHPHFTFVAVADADTGRVLAATDGIFEDGSVLGRPVFDNGKKGLFLGEVHDAVRLAQLLPAPADGSPLRFVDVGAPVLDPGGRVSRVLVAHIGWDWAAALRAQVLAAIEDERQVEIMAADSQGRIVLSSNPRLAYGSDVNDMLRQGPGDAQPWSDGQRYITRVVDARTRGPFPDFGWRILARQPEAAVQVHTDRLAGLFLLGGLLLGTLGSVVAWHLAGRVLRPVTALADQADQLRSGGQPSAPDSTLPTEVARVHHAFARVSRDAADHARQSAARLAAISNAVPQMLWVGDAQGWIVHANDRLLAYMGVGEAALLSQRSLMACMHEEDAARYGQDWAAAAAGGHGFEQEARMGDGQGGWRWHLHRAVPQHGADGVVLGWFGSVTDIDALKQAQLRLLAMDRRKDEFIATLSHELRNPLAPVANAVALMRRQAPTEAQSKLLEMMSRQVGHLGRLVDDLMDAARIRHRRVALRMSSCEVAVACEDAVEATRGLAEDKGHTLEVRLPDQLPPVMADPTRLAQMVTNLLHNACKYTEPGGNILLEARPLAGCMEISVTDNGCGIDPQLLPWLFETFAQGPMPLDRAAGGLGLGLSIVRELALLHGGQVRVDSDGPGRGSRFTLSLPLAAHALADEAASAHPGGRGGLTVS
ncbi:ATP-binding protein [Ramlibacter tataouinensis]|uniref:histidine kinase n=1 Tax=Ramlibacter tataouinensis (strain ATCC BAA-407 / DSM 14655 / LMG 21543 / TTB310) TaxID=365046 RepID=F5Y2T9_RAMTT|nr:ATP-binding protein [Ramlibacter tataouinensis]AEG93635.1 candidate histidine kinase, classic [Ramlibacter tataouinensis TTB310]